MIPRRKFLQLLGIAPVAAPVAVKALSEMPATVNRVAGSGYPMTATEVIYRQKAAFSRYLGADATDGPSC